MLPRSIKIASFSRTLLRLLSTRWPRIRVMMQVRRSPPGSMNLPIHPSIENSLKQCLITIENCSVLKTSSKSSSKKPSKEVSPFLRFFHLRKRSSMRKPRKWPTNTVGSYSPISPSVIKMMVTLTVSCSINQKFYKIKRLIGISMRQ